MLLWLLSTSIIQLQAQQPDTIKTTVLETVEVRGSQLSFSFKPDVSATYIFSGKKNEVIHLTKSPVALTEKYGRQVFAKIPGVFVYDMDGTGNQVNVSARGLDPHRGWEFNIRKDGIITNSDMYGYPASHYSMPMEAVERIELVRGTGALQYGAQFGGMLNYVSKQPDSTKVFAFENISTVGSYGLLSTFMRASGKAGKLLYNTWLNYRTLDGYRENSHSDFDAYAIEFFYDFSDRLKASLAWTKSNYTIQLAGPLTDSMFYANPRMATRARNYYNPNIHVPSLKLNWKLSSRSALLFSASGVLGKRNSVLFDKPATTEDVINPITLQYANRQVDIDTYNSYTSEVRYLHHYKLAKHTSTFAVGLQYMNNNLLRKQQGVGTTGTDFDLSLVIPGWGRDLTFKTNNLAAFAENSWTVHKRFTVNTGIRVEHGTSLLNGTTAYYPEEALPNTIRHQFVLAGASAQFRLTESINFYGGWSQSYRPVILKDIVPASVYEVTDKNLSDAFGHNAEIGFRGNRNNLTWDVSAFQIRYNNRLGTLAEMDDFNNLIIRRTNIGNSITHGVELFFQYEFSISSKFRGSWFTSSSWMDAHYTDAIVRKGDDNVSISGNRVESVPNVITRNGFSVSVNRITASLLYSYTSSSFADPFNTITPSATGSVGLVPAYSLWDANFSARVSPHVTVQANINNLTDKQYFTKRPQFYPGPGIWPSDGRAFSLTVRVFI
ncbi:MAG: TonB-dependent receptor family protein [Cyclobacteriaceae bacterium]